ncbi:thymidylate synthase (FAD), partial [Helicobacter pylori]
ALQELSRHRIASLSVKSSRYTLRELKEVESFLPLNEMNLERAKEFLVFVDNEKVNAMSVLALENLRV